VSEVRARFAVADKPLIIAHRGDWSKAPENSRAAIRAAQAFDMVEIDVRLTADGVPVVMHDHSALRTTGVDARIGDLTAAEITDLTLLDSDEPVPTLSQALEAGGTKLLFDLDVKTPGELEAVADFLATRPERDRSVLKIDVDTLDDIDALLALGPVDIQRIPPAGVRFCLWRGDLAEAIWLIGRTEQRRQAQNPPRPTGVSPKSPSSASFELEIDHYSGAQIPRSERFWTETGGIR
jgi:hypothetical protein